jgi:hypothetical protein
MTNFEDLDVAFDSEGRHRRKVDIGKWTVDSGQWSGGQQQKWTAECLRLGDQRFIVELEEV